MYTSERNFLPSSQSVDAQFRSKSFAHNHGRLLLFLTICRCLRRIFCTFVKMQPCFELYLDNMSGSLSQKQIMINFVLHRKSVVIQDGYLQLEGAIWPANTVLDVTCHIFPISIDIQLKKHPCGLFKGFQHKSSLGTEQKEDNSAALVLDRRGSTNQDRHQEPAEALMMITETIFTRLLGYVHSKVRHSVLPTFCLPFLQHPFFHSSFHHISEMPGPKPAWKFQY